MVPRKKCKIYLIYISHQKIKNKSVNCKEINLCPKTHGVLLDYNNINNNRIYITPLLEDTRRCIFSPRTN